jgi:alginate O-acetyltransferase complex protein AlgI
VSFASFAFLLFLPAVFAVHWSLRGRRAQNAVLLAASLVFYGWWDVRFLGLMVGAALLDFAVARYLEVLQTPRSRRLLLAASLVANLGLLAFFKYFHFFADSLVAAAGAAGWELRRPTLQILLPVGISFYTFQTLSYTIDVYRGRIRASRSVLDYLVYVTFFPQLVAGPIERADRLLPQFATARTFDPGAAWDGGRQMLWGLVKKVLIADTLAAAADPVFGKAWAYGGDVLAVAVVAFAFQIYADFSAYSDIAVGAAKLLGIRLSRNFAYPYFSRSLLEFWRRWHISLSSWFRDYLYVPLGGNRKGRARQAAHLLTVFVLSGLWHGAAWTFVLWGLIHGLMILPAALSRTRPPVPENETPGGERDLPRPGDLLRMAGTFLVVCIAWVFFRAASVGDAFLILGRIGGVLPGPAIPLPLPPAVPGERIAGLIAGLLLADWARRRAEHPLADLPWPRACRWALYTSLLWMAFLLGPQEGSPFYYFQF